MDNPNFISYHVIGGVGSGKEHLAHENKSSSIYVDQKSKLKIGRWWSTTVHSGGPTTLADMAWTVTDVFHIAHHGDQWPTTLVQQHKGQST